jgi:uncharacterized protein YkuJ
MMKQYEETIDGISFYVEEHWAYKGKYKYYKHFRLQVASSPDEYDYYDIDMTKYIELFECIKKRYPHAKLIVSAQLYDGGDVTIFAKVGF